MNAIHEMPSTIENPMIEIFYQRGDPPFICGAHGHVTSWMFEDIEKDIDENLESILDQGCGTYLFRVSRFEGQYGDHGRCELASGWEYDLLQFQHIYRETE